MGVERLVARHPIEAALCGNPAQERTSKAVRLEDAVPGGAEGRSGSAAFCAAIPRAVGWIVGNEERFGSEAQDATVADLVPRNQRVFEIQCTPIGTCEYFLLLKDRLDWQEPECRYLTITALNGISYALSEHLVATADPQGRE